MTKQAYLTKIRRYKNKREAVFRKGNKCLQCGWTGHLAGFIFHHPDPSQKEFGLSGESMNWEKYWNEAQKCSLLCARCHTILHSDYDDPQFLKDVECYEGRELVESNIPWKNKTHIPTTYSRKCPVCECEFETSRKTQYLCSTKCHHTNRRKCERPSKKKNYKKW